jgi:hypothetical protein
MGHGLRASAAFPTAVRRWRSSMSTTCCHTQSTFRWLAAKATLQVRWSQRSRCTGRRPVLSRGVPCGRWVLYGDSIGKSLQGRPLQLRRSTIVVLKRVPHEFVRIRWPNRNPQHALLQVSNVRCCGRDLSTALARVAANRKAAAATVSECPLSYCDVDTS